MITFEEVRMKDLVEKFEQEILEIQQTRAMSKFQQAGAALQKIYNFHLTADASFIKHEEYLKNLYTTFNYAAVIVNDAIKNKKMDKENTELLNECIDILLGVCTILKKNLTQE